MEARYPRVTMDEPGQPGSEPEPSKPSQPAGPAFLGDMMRMLGGAANPWQLARELAINLANEGRTESNVDPLERLRIEELAQLADRQVTRNPVLPDPPGDARFLVVTRAEWAHHTLAAYRPVLDTLAGALTAAPLVADQDEAGDPFSAMLGQLMGALAPMMLGGAAGSMVGHMARRSLGSFDLPVPRPIVDPLLIVPANLALLAEEWSLEADDLRIWVAAEQLVWYRVLGVAHVDAALRRLLGAHAGSYRNDPDVLTDRLTDFDLSNPAALGELQGLLGDPEMLLGAMRTPEQEEHARHLHDLLAVLLGVVDLAMEEAGAAMLGPNSRVAEAIHRHRVEADASDSFIEKLLGLELAQEQVDRGEAFVRGVIERAGAAGLGSLWANGEHLPTTAEVDAPGLWLARIELLGD